MTAATTPGYDARLPRVTPDLHLHPPRPHQGPAAAATAVRRATKFINLVRDEGTDSIGAYLDQLNPDQHYALTTTLAAMVPDDVPANELLAWTTNLLQETA